MLGRQRTGDECYVLNLLRHLPAVAAEGSRGDVRIGAVGRHPELIPEGVTRVDLPARSTIVRMLLTLPRALSRADTTLAHFQYVVPPLWRGPSVVTVHDLSFVRHPEQGGHRDRVFLRALVPRAVRRARVVLTVSEFTKADIIEHYKLPENKVVVTYNGLDPAFGPDGPRPAGSPYLLFVGALQPRKDPIGALRAYARLGNLKDDLRLLMVGPEKHDVGSVRDEVTALGLEHHVELLGHVDQDELAALYRGAECLVFPSTYEGFGLPVLEAMASGTPVVTTNATALPEVAGDAAVLVPVGDPEALAAGILEALDRKDALVSAGLARAGLFRWEDCARRTFEAYQAALLG